MTLTFKLNIGYDIQKEYITPKNNKMRCDTMVNVMCLWQWKFFSRMTIKSGPNNLKM